MIYDIFASKTDHIFTIYARTKEHFMSLLRGFWQSITAKNEKENRVDSTVRVRHIHGDIKV